MRDFSKFGKIAAQAWNQLKCTKHFFFGLVGDWLTTVRALLVIDNAAKRKKKEKEQTAH